MVLDIKLKEEPEFQQRDRIPKALANYRFNSSSPINFLLYF